MKRVSFNASSTPSLAQAINPWSMWNDSQYGLINIRYGASSNPELEQRIVEDVAGYGKQIGRAMDALRSVVTALHNITPELQNDKAIVDFINLADTIDQEKKRYRSDNRLVQELVENVNSLKREDEGRYQAVREQLIDTLQLHTPQEQQCSSDSTSNSG